MLREKQQGSLRSFHSGAVSEPCGHRNARCMLWCDAGHVEHDDSEATGLQQQVGNAKSLLDSCPRFEARLRFEGLIRCIKSAGVGGETAGVGSRSRFGRGCGSAQRGAEAAGCRKLPTASLSPFTSVRGCGPKPPPWSPFLIAGGSRYFSGRRNVASLLCC